MFQLYWNKIGKIVHIFSGPYLFWVAAGGLEIERGWGLAVGLKPSPGLRGSEAIQAPSAPGSQPV